MKLVSLWFLVFLLITVVVYYIVPKRCQWIVLLVSSLAFFCLVGTWWTLIYLLASIIVTWFAGVMISKHNESMISNAETENLSKNDKISDESTLLIDSKPISQTKIVSKKAMKSWFYVALIINLCLLAALKYTNFILGNASSIYGLFSGQEVSWKVNWIAALGISFYTLQVVGYLLDCYWGISKPQKNIFKFALFSCFFPQMVSGPISRYNQLGEQLEKEHKLEWSNIRAGVIRIIVGFFKKLVVADSIAQFCSAWINDTQGIFVFFGMIFYVIQIYADFAGCMDIVLGSAKCLGIDMVENFKSPFRSLTIQEFWRNWHITLGQWLKDYVMYPLLRTKLFIKMTKKIKSKAGKRCAKLIPTHIAMLVLWFCMGLWHGGGWNFILEGVWFWAVIVAGEWLSPLFKKCTKKFKEDNFFWVWFRRLRTMTIYAIGALMFRATSVSDFFSTIGRMLSPSSIINSIQNIKQNIQIAFDFSRFGFVVFAIIGFILLLVIARIEYKNGGLANKLEKKPVFFQVLIMFLIVLAIVYLGTYGTGYNAADFIYGGF